MSSIKKFNAYKNIRIDRVKAHHSVIRPKKKKGQARCDIDYEGDWEGHMAQPWEIANVKNLCAGKPKKNLKRERIFDTMDDGKPLKVKKESKAAKMKTAFVMCDSKKFHQIDGRYIAATL
tara:strand:- start:57 stop:416 length:360 start_codon:yes stop_codon:yes gene_type:complete